MCVLWTQIKLLTSHFSGKDYYPYFYCLKKAIRNWNMSSALSVVKLVHALMSLPLVLYVLGDYGYTCPPRKAMLCQNWNYKAPTFLCFLCHSQLNCELFIGLCALPTQKHWVSFCGCTTCPSCQVTYITRSSAEQEVWVLDFCYILPPLAFIHLVSFF